MKTYESKGVKCRIRQSGYHRNEIVDIEVERGVKTVDFDVPALYNLSICLNTVMKQFPDVEYLNIPDSIVDIDISNFMFPNVKKVTSKNVRFPSGCLLLQKTYNGLVLLNAFCRPERDVIDLHEVRTIKPYALEGTYARKFINTENIIISRFDHDVLSGHISQINPSIFMNNGVLTIGNSLCMVNKTMKRIIIPESISSCSSEVDFSTIDEVVVRSMQQLITIGSSINSKTVLIDDNERIDFNTLISCKMRADVKISKDNPFYSSDDGIIYNRDKKILISYPSTLNNKSIDIPDSVCEIRDNAFCGCRYLTSVKIGNGVVEIGENAFSGCDLKNIYIPKNVKLIKKNAFNSSRVKCVTLNDGLQEIMEGAFRYNQIQEIHIPKTVKRMGANSLPFYIKDVYVDEQYPADIIHSLMDENLGKNSESYCIHIKNYGNVYLPKSMTKTSIDFLNSEFNLRQLDNKFTNSIYEYGADTAGKQNTAILSYKDTKDEAVGKYLRRAGRSIAKRLIEEQDNDMLIQFVNTGLLTGKTLRVVMDMANNANMSIAAAYILKEIEGSDANTSFRL